MKIEITTKTPDEIKHDNPLLFVHGGWHGSWCWEKYFVPYFVNHGYECHTFNFRGHGGTSNNKSLKRTTIGDYVRDLTQVIEGIDKDPILIAHSMGGLVVQNYLTQHNAPAAVLLAPVPPWGVIRTTLKVAFRYPLSFLKANLLLSLYPLVNNEKKVRKLFFTEDLAEDELSEYAKLIEDESYLAFLGMLFLSLPKTKKVNTSMYILGGDQDWIFNPKQIKGTAKRYKADSIIFEGVGHNMMLDPRWESVANKTLEWLGSSFSSA